MQISQIKIKNFKAIKVAKLPLSQFNVIVGPNGSGKSSVLQALHWVIQCGRNPAVDANKDYASGSTLSLSNASYMPSPDYKNSGNSGTYGNRADANRLDLSIWARTPADTGPDVRHRAKLWLKAARNEGVSVHIPSNNEITTAIRAQAREFSAYIPGLAGIPLSEERRAHSIVLRQAAAGDANTVLRNILHLLALRENDQEDPSTPMTELQTLVSKAIRRTELKITFDDKKDYSIQAHFKTDAMSEYRPLELAGIGFLQSIQIFAYILLYRPRLLLIDEPDSHLHPDAQQRLVTEIANAAKKHDCQVIMTTHSPSVVRAMPEGANMIWMQNGKVQKDAEAARLRMGWGILDKNLVLLTEDKNIDQLRLFLSQWPDLDRQVAIWPLNGSGNLPKADVVDGLRNLLGDVPILLHRDGDMMNDAEKSLWKAKWGLDDQQAWVTQGADIEAYFVNADYCAAVSDTPAADFQTIIDGLCPNKPSTDFNKKREDARALYPKGDAVPSNDHVFAELCTFGAGSVVKKSVRKLRAKVQSDIRGGVEAKIGKVMSPDCELAPDLKEAIEMALLI